MVWNDWIAQHASIFGQHDERDLAHLGHLAGIFAEAGWTPEELLAASRWVALHDPPKFRDAMLRALQERVRQVRQQGAARETAQPTFEDDCRLCGNTGWVPVPCPQARKKGGYLEYLACCICPLGRWRSQQGDQRPRLELWRDRMPDWREFRDAHHRQKAAELAAVAQAGELDRQCGPLAMPRAFVEALRKAQGGQGE